MTTSYYSSLSAAITVVNGGTAETVAAENAKAAIITSPCQLTKVKLLADVSESAEITVNEDIDLVLNGYTLRFTEIGGYLHFNTGTNSVIHGAGGAIVKNLDTAASDNAMLVSSDGNSLQIRGGSYTVSADTTGTVLAIRAATTETATCDLLELEDCTVEAKNTSGMAIGIQTSAQNTYVHNIKCDADGSGNSRGFMSNGIVKVEESHIVCNSTDSYSTAMCIMDGSASAEHCIFNATAETHMAYAVYIDSGMVSIDSSDIRADAYNYAAKGIELDDGDLTVCKSTITATGHKGTNATAGGIGTHSGTILRVKNSSILADATPNSVEAGNNTGGINNGGTAYLENVSVSANHSAVQNSGKLYVNGGTYTGFCHGGFYFAHGSDGEAFVNDAIIRGGHYKGAFDYSEIPENIKLAALYIGGGSDEHNSSMTAYLDGCFFDASDCHRSIVVRGSSNEINNTLNISNCFVTNGTLDDGTIRIDDTMCTGCGLCETLCKFDAIKLCKEGDK